MAERAVTLNPNLSAGWTSRGWISIMQSEPKRALESFENTMRLSPLDPMRPFLFSGMAFAYFLWIATMKAAALLGKSCNCFLMFNHLAPTS